MGRAIAPRRLEFDEDASVGPEAHTVLGQWGVVAAICGVYVILGTAMEELSMILLTIPVFFPVIVHLGFDPVWFGIIIVCVVEIGLISPPSA